MARMLSAVTGPTMAVTDGLSSSATSIALASTSLLRDTFSTSSASFNVLAGAACTLEAAATGRGTGRGTDFDTGAEALGGWVWACDVVGSTVSTSRCR